MLTLSQLPESALEHRPPGFETLTQLAWSVLWLASWGYGINHIRARWEGSVSAGWSKRVAAEIATLLASRGLEIPQPWPGKLSWRAGRGRSNL